MLATDLMIPAVADIRGTSITYYDSRDEKDRDDVLVMVHGTSGSTKTHFGFLFPILAAKQRVVSIDWSQPDRDGERLELDQLVDQVAGAIEVILPGRKVVLLGYSLGAVVTAALAARRPDLVERLVLVAGWMKTDLQQILRNDVWQALRASGDDAIRSYSTFCAFGGPFLGSKTLADLQPAMDAMAFDAFGDQQMELNRRIDIVEEVHRISVPTLVIGCTHDQMVPIRHQKALFGAIEDARFAEIPTGHAVVFERPSELTHHIQRFLDEPEAFTAGSIVPTPQP
ncbi:alpha/beta fold hydrolase [Arthrobacter mangrovi]|uniref:Alpha/beta hydrolase n=1 Tax=Arthrobacter mangrovi TaxID=2966350 RepID=A0ABQ5MZM3_9MICC|nr:alpha/beta hydrolase [Arthrobacter mangrovi]GLB69152.1 alpha/beta hydrolase [Arthrobacter mangrovi]